MKIKIKILPGGTLPTRGSREAAGYDIYAAEDAEIGSLQIAKIRTGVCFQMPPGTFGQIYGRSGMAANRGLLSVAGTLDSDFTGEVSVVLFNTSSDSQKIRKGDRIAQVVFHRHIVVDWVKVLELEPTERGSGSFGSTGR